MNNDRWSRPKRGELNENMAMLRVVVYVLGSAGLTTSCLILLHFFGGE